jgi:hypothetical protein
MITMKACKDCGVRPTAQGRSRCYSCYRKFRVLPTFTPAPEVKTLYIDIETAPNMGMVWGQWQQNLTLPQITDFTEVLCFAYKWAHEDEVQFVRKDIALTAWRLFNEADVVVHFYGSKFDVPHLNREFLQSGLGPPRPYKQVDLKIEAAKRFKFTSNKLQHISQAVGLGGKIDNSGWELWIRCLLGVEESWAEMEEYNRQDVVLLEELHHILLPWLSNQPNAYLYGAEEGVCPKCSGDLDFSGFYYTKLSCYMQHTCLSCGSHFRDSKRVMGASIQDAVL